MTTITNIRILLQIALVGAVLCGATFGFWFKGDELELIRMIGAVTAVFITIVINPKFFHQQT